MRRCARAPRAPRTTSRSCCDSAQAAAGPGQPGQSLPADARHGPRRRMHRQPHWDRRQREKLNLELSRPLEPTGLLGNVCPLPTEPGQVATRASPQQPGEQAPARGRKRPTERRPGPLGSEGVRVWVRAPPRPPPRPRPRPQPLPLWNGRRPGARVSCRLPCVFKVPGPLAGPGTPGRLVCSLGGRSCPAQGVLLRCPPRRGSRVGAAFPRGHHALEGEARLQAEPAARAVLNKAARAWVPSTRWCHSPLGPRHPGPVCPHAGILGSAA